MVAPLVKVKSVHKHTARFKRHQSDRKISVKVRGAWAHAAECRRACPGPRGGRLCAPA